jgi:hypothetical protein
VRMRDGEIVDDGTDDNSHVVVEEEALALADEGVNG